jgi:Family of unknown function (DUF5670)
LPYKIAAPQGAFFCPRTSLSGQGATRRSVRYRTDNEGDAGQDPVNPPTTGRSNNEKAHSMIYTIAVVLIVLWLLGLVTSYTMGGFVHILLVVALIMIVVNLLSGRRGA